MPLIRIHNVDTGEIIDREMNAQELAQLEADKAKAAIKAQELAEAEAKRLSALAKLVALGLTTDDLTALGL